MIHKRLIKVKVNYFCRFSPLNITQNNTKIILKKQLFDAEDQDVSDQKDKHFFI